MFRLKRVSLSIPVSLQRGGRTRLDDFSALHSIAPFDGSNALLSMKRMRQIQPKKRSFFVWGPEAHSHDSRWYASRLSARPHEIHPRVPERPSSRCGVVASPSFVATSICALWRRMTFCPVFCYQFFPNHNGANRLGNRRNVTGF